MPEYIFIAQFKHGFPSLIRALIKKETLKQYQVESPEDILGCSWIGSKINKSERHCFNSERKALSFLHGAATAYVQQCSKETARAQRQVVSLEQLIGEAERENDKPQL